MHESKLLLQNISKIKELHNNPFSVFAADIWTSEQNIGLANKLKSNNVHILDWQETSPL